MSPEVGLILAGILCTGAFWYGILVLVRFARKVR